MSVKPNAGDRAIWASLGVYSPDQQRQIQEFVATLPAMDDAALLKAANEFIWLSAYAANNPRSAYHPMCDAVYDECQRRDRPDIYSTAHATQVRQAGG